MLPTAFLEAIIRCQGVRVGDVPAERRRSARLPIKGTAMAYRVSEGKVGEQFTARLRDISTTGIAVLTTDIKPLDTGFLLGLELTEKQTVWLLCSTRRQTVFDNSCTVTCAMFIRLLAPDQELLPGTDCRQLNWLDLSLAPKPRMNMRRL